MLVGKNRIVHFPELAMGASKFCHLGGRASKGMDFHQREVAVNQTQAFAEAGLDLLHDRLRRSTMWTLIVTIFNERNRGVVATLNMVTRTDGNFEPGHLFSPARVRRP